MTRAVIDIETRSAADLKEVGSHVYAEHPTTSVTHFAYKIDGGETKMWRPSCEIIPDDLYAVLVAPDATLVAHNAPGFERVVLTGHAGIRTGIPAAAIRPIGRWSCTAARAAVLGLPRTLEGACQALKMNVQKDREGHALMLRVSKPRAPRKGEDPSVIYWWEDEERMARMDAYCIRDVDAEYGLDTFLPELSELERATWEFVVEMNDRGVLVDRDMLRAVPVMIEQAETKMNADLVAKTGGAVPAITDAGALARWLTAQGIEDHIDPKTRKASVAKDVIAKLLDGADLDPLIRQVLLLRQEGGGSSSKKWRAIEERLSDDGRARGAFVYCGASSTGRLSSRGIQLQNLPRGGAVPSIERAIDDLLAGYDAEFMELVYAPPLIVASEMLRPAFVAPPGALLARGDYSQIEARVGAWLAGADWKLDAFRAYDAGTGPDLYKIAAAGVFRCAPEEITKERRQTGKVAELALGFGGGAGALQNMAKAYGMQIPRHPRGPDGMPVKSPGGPAIGTDEWVKLGWRKANPETCGLWLGLETAALACMGAPMGDITEVWTMRRTWVDGSPIIERMHKTPLTFRRNKSALCLRLPSGRGIYYWSPNVRKTNTPFGQKWTLWYFAEDSVTRRWKDWPMWGGLATENAVQATARDVMCYAFVQLCQQGCAPVLSVHDELVIEIAGLSAADAIAFVVNGMSVTPTWAEGLPIAVDGSAGPRYVKA